MRHQRQDVKRKNSGGGWRRALLFSGPLPCSNLTSPRAAPLYPRRVRYAAILSVIVCAALPAFAADFDATVFAGYFSGSNLGITAEGGISDDATPDAGAGFGVALDFPSPQNTTLQLYYSYHPTAVHSDSYFEYSDVDLNIHYMQIGGTYLWKQRPRLWPYIGLTVGGTLFDSELSGTSLNLSGAAAGGFQIGVSDRVGVRLDARWFGTALSTSGTIGCSNAGVCVGAIDGTAYYEFVASAGITYRIGR